ncbi:MAG: NFACT RNA binding domain-containing protein, partial [Oscillospiraceae bacterium]|nr:NFACT RNA binding domain-containing protein [Oscillospiraceae bacterium]
TQITKTIDEISYLESIQISLDLAQNKADYDAIRSELNLNSKTKNLCKSVRGASVSSVCKINPHMTIDSFDIYLGKNNTQNDHLSLKFAQNGDIWLHAQKLAGSHVLIRTHGREVPPNVLEAAARLAKEHSKAKNEAKATIDYCLAKFVKKPNAAKAGLVTYSNFSSIIV